MERNMGEYKLTKPSGLFDRGKRTILVVDSDANSSFYTTTLLKRLNYEICSTTTVEEALASAVRTKPSLIIASLSFKDMDGSELIRLFRKNPATDAVPVIVLSKKGDPEAAQRCLECGVIDCLVQPIPVEQLYRVVQKATETRPRKDIRIRTLQPVKIGSVLPETFETACVLDLSERGVFLHAAKPAPVDQRLSLQIDLNHMIIPVEAEVIYSYRTPTGPYLQAGMGLRFVQIDPEDQGYIRQFVRDEVTRGIVPGNA
jgi:CheY-like chemotaxis protein